MSGKVIHFSDFSDEAHFPELWAHLRQRVLQDANASYRLCVREWSEEWCRSAVKLYRPLAERGDIEAQFRLGHASRDDDEAMMWLRRAAERGHTEAGWRLGSYYMVKGSQDDSEEAVKWFRRGAEKGDPVSQKALGEMYADGDGVPQDYVSAYKWYELAAQGALPKESGAQAVSPKEALRFKKMVMGLRDKLATTKMTSQQIAEAQRLAREWLERRPAGGQQ
jgi:TPR repeat protein